ncbi:MAG: magnesium transporter [Nitrospinaceae bacterium]
MPLEKLKSILKTTSQSPEELTGKIAELDHFEVARLLHELSGEQKLLVFKAIASDTQRHELLYETDVDSRRDLMDALGPDALGAILEKMPPDEATDILQDNAPEVQEEILQKIDTKDARLIKDLISYREETAGGMMNPHFNRVTQDQLAGDLLMTLIRHPNADHGYYFFVVDDQDRLAGHFQMRDLLRVPANWRVDQFAKETTPKVVLDDPCEKVANLMDHENMSIIPVVDDHNRIQGIVTFDDVFRVLKDEASEDIFTMVGTALEDPFAKPILSKVKARAPWLMITFFGGLLGAYVLHAFQFTIAEFTTVLLFVPFVLGLAGNVGIQGATVIVRGLATEDIQEDNLRTVVRSELSVGMLNGVLFGILCGGVITAMARPLLDAEPVLGLSVGVGIFLAVSTAALIGSLAPWAMLKLGADPAISTGPVVTVINDILGLTIYLAAATLIFSLLG